MLQMPDDDPDIVFLSSSLNNVLVSGILKGINLSLLKARGDNNQANLNTAYSTSGRFKPAPARPKEQIETTHFNEIEIIDPKFFENLSMRQMKNFVNQVKLDSKKTDDRLSRTFR